MNIHLNLVANVAGGSSNNERSGFMFESSNGQSYVIQIDDLDHEEVVIETIETGPAVDATEIENGAPSCANQNEIDGSTIATQNTSDVYNSNNEYALFKFFVFKCVVKH